MSIIENKIMKKIKGFTLLEAVFAIAVTILCAQILFGLIGTLRKINRQKTGVNEISYSYVQINNFLKESEHVEVSTTGSDPTKIVLRKLSDKKKKNGDLIYDTCVIDMSSNDVLRMRTDEGGHMPLLFQVKKIKCSTSKDSFSILVTEKDGRQSEMFFKTDLPKKKENKIQDEKKIRVKRLKGSALISSLLLINICITFVMMYQRSFTENMESNLSLINYFSK